MPAGKLYCSTWFLKASAYAQQIADEWFILSAKDGLVDPETVIAPYDVKLSGKRKVVIDEPGPDSAQGYIERMRPDRSWRPVWSG